MCFNMYGSKRLLPRRKWKLLKLMTIFKFIFLLQFIFILYTIIFIPYIVPVKWSYIAHYDIGNLSKYFKIHNSGTFVKSYQVFDSHTTFLVQMDRNKDTSVKLVKTDNDRIYPSEVIPDSIAVGLGITSLGTYYSTKDEIIGTFPFFTTLLPSFCKTMSKGYFYSFFLAYDFDDIFFCKTDNLKQFAEIFIAFVHLQCPRNNKYSINFVQCNHSGQPARAQNDAMMEAYMSNMEYYYRVNDDSNLITPGWTKAFIKALQSYNPPNIGVVGPEHTGGNTNILTHDFVHYSHIEIFGFYYPRDFTGWYADNWITKVYMPDRSRKLQDVKLSHTQVKGKRYYNDISLEKLKAPLIEIGKQTLHRYITSLNSSAAKKQPSDKIISTSLSGRIPSHIYAAIRNAQLLHVYVPGWQMRIYVPSTSSVHRVSIRVINKLKILGVDLVFVNSKFDYKFWKYLIFDEKKSNYFLIWDINDRFSTNLQSVSNIFNSKEKSSFCFSHNRDRAVDNFIGCQNIHLKKIFKENVHNLLIKASKTADFNANSFFINYIWPNIRNITVYDEK